MRPMMCVAGMAVWEPALVASIGSGGVIGMVYRYFLRNVVELN